MWKKLKRLIILLIVTALSIAGLNDGYENEKQRFLYWIVAIAWGGYLSFFWYALIKSFFDKSLTQTKG